MIGKNLWIRRILYSVRDIASKEYQERAWLRWEIHWPCTFEEMMCTFFEYCFIEEFINEKMDEFGLSIEQKTLLSELVCALDQYDDNLDIYEKDVPLSVSEEYVLKDPKWHKIREMAQKVLDAFGKIQYEPEDKESCVLSIYQAIFAYADINEQRQMWVDKSEDFWSTPLDMYELLFVSYDLDHIMDNYAKMFDLTEEQIDKVEQFRLQLKKTPFKTVDPEGVINHPDWKKLQVLARAALEALLPHIAKDHRAEAHSNR